MNMQSATRSSNQPLGTNGVAFFTTHHAPFLLASAVVLILSLVFFQGCKEDEDIEFASIWRQQEITVDGDDSEWRDHITIAYFDKNPVGIGIKNDSTDLYLLLKTTDNPTKQTLMRTGFTVWFEADDEKKKTFGIRYPIGLNEHLRTRSYDPSEWRDNEERLKRQIPEMLTEIEIIGPGEHDRNRISRVNPYGISVGLTDTSAALIYEVKIPLMTLDDLPYQIGAEPGSVIRVGLETGSMDHGRRAGRGHGPGHGGGGGHGGGHGGSPERGEHPSGMESGEPLEVWLKLHLATETDLYQENGKT
jgi:hypothetical protein